MKICIYGAGAIGGYLGAKLTEIGADVTLSEFHEYSVEWEGSDLIYRLDEKEVHRNIGLGDNYPEPMFAILNFAKITDNSMQGEWVMEVDWVKHEFRNN